jgi:hypothetical protein
MAMRTVRFAKYSHSLALASSHSLAPLVASTDAVASGLLESRRLLAALQKRLSSFPPAPRPTDDSMAAAPDASKMDSRTDCLGRVSSRLPRRAGCPV